MPWFVIFTYKSDQNENCTETVHNSNSSCFRRYIINDLKTTLVFFNCDAQTFAQRTQSCWITSHAISWSTLMQYWKSGATFSWVTYVNYHHIYILERVHLILARLEDRVQSSAEEYCTFLNFVFYRCIVPSILSVVFKLLSTIKILAQIAFRDRLQGLSWLFPFQDGNSKIFLFFIIIICFLV